MKMTATAGSAQASSGMKQSSSSGDKEKMCQLLFVSTSQLLLPNITAALSTTYFHQLMDHYGWQSVQTNNITVLLTALLFLACKATEQLRSIRDIYNAVTLQRHSSVSLEDMDKGYVMRKEAIIAAEHQILRVISFDVEVDLPFKYLLNIARHLRLRQRPVHLAWMLLNDSYRSGQRPRGPCPLLACAGLWCGLQLASSCHPIGSDAQEQLPVSWWRAFGVEDEDALQRACCWLLDLWEQQTLS